MCYKSWKRTKSTHCHNLFKKHFRIFNHSGLKDNNRNINRPKANYKILICSLPNTAFNFNPQHPEEAKIVEHIWRMKYGALKSSVMTLHGLHAVHMICSWMARPLTLVIGIIHINQLKDLFLVVLHVLTYLRPWRWQLPEKWLGLLPWLFSHSNKTCSACCTWGWTKWLRSHWRAGPAPPLGPAHWSYWLQGWRMGGKSNGMRMLGWEVVK